MNEFPQFSSNRSTVKFAGACLWWKFWHFHEHFHLVSFIFTIKVHFPLSVSGICALKCSYLFIRLCNISEEMQVWNCCIPENGNKLSPQQCPPNRPVPSCICYCLRIDRLRLWCIRRGRSVSDFYESAESKALGQFWSWIKKLIRVKIFLQAVSLCEENVQLSVNYFGRARSFLVQLTYRFIYIKASGFSHLKLLADPGRASSERYWRDAPRLRSETSNWPQLASSNSHVRSHCFGTWKM